MLNNLKIIISSIIIIKNSQQHEAMYKRQGTIKGNVFNNIL